MSTFEAEPAAQQPTPRQLVLTGVAATMSAVLWLAAGIGTICDVATDVPDTVVGGLQVLAATVTVVAVMLGLDYRRRAREAGEREAAEVRHAEVLARMTEVAADALNKAKWSGFAEGLKETLDPPAAIGSVLPLARRANGHDRP